MIGRGQGDSGRSRGTVRETVRIRKGNGIQGESKEQTGMGCAADMGVAPIRMDTGVVIDEWKWTTYI